MPSPPTNILLSALAASLAATGLAAAPAAAAPPSKDALVVLRESGTTAAQAKRGRDTAKVQLIGAGKGLVERVAPKAGRSRAAAIAALEKDPTVVGVEPEREIRAVASEGPDTFFNRQWSLANDGSFSGSVAHVDISAGEAWAQSVGAGVTVAVADSGADLTHPDLAGRIAGGWDYVDNDGTPSDLNGHGTHVTGIIAANKDNGIGVAGIAPGSTVDVLRVLDANGTGTTSSAAAALDAAATRGDRIVNVSYSSPTYSAIEAAVIARHPDVLYIAAAGNVGADVDQTPAYPCALPLDNVICVGASTASDRRASYSSYGRVGVDVFAPGDQIASTWLNGAYAFNSGTSMAAPAVAGIGALVLSKYPAMTAPQLRAALLAGVVRPSALAGFSVTGGRVNAAAALAASERIGAENNPGGGDTSVPDDTTPGTDTGVVKVPSTVPNQIVTPIKITGLKLTGTARTSRRSTAQLRFSLDAAAAVTVRLTREVCKTKKAKGAKKAKRSCGWRTMKTLKIKARKGANRVALKGRTKVAGRWKAAITAQKTTRSVRFTVRRG